MQIKKGPYGHYAIERIDGNTQLYHYAEEIINTRLIKEIFPITADTLNGMVELSFEFSGFLSINDYMTTDHGIKPSVKDLIRRRESVRAFLHSLSKLTDMLLFPCALCRNSDYIFTDDKGSCVRFCMYPLRYEPEELTLAVIGEDNAEELLEHPFFSSVLTADEIQQITFAVSSGNNKMLREICEGMDKDKWVGYYKHKDHVDLFRMPSQELVFSLLCSIISIFSFSTGLLPVCALFFMASVVFLIMMKFGNGSVNKLPVTPFLKERSGKRNDDRQLADGRREALFDYANAEVNESPASVGPLMIRGASPNSEDIKYGMYSDRIIIGSDRFLADLFIDKKGVASIHAEISRQNGNYYIRSLSEKNPTFLENRKLAVEHDYELKSGQRLLIGDAELTLTCGFG